MTCQSLSEAWEVSDLKEKAQQKLWQPFQREVQIKLFNLQVMPIKPFSIGSQGTLILYTLIQTSLLFRIIKNLSYMVPFILILGLASYGNVCRAIVQELLNNQPEKIKAYQARFVGHVFPGEKYAINIWKEGNTIIFEALVK